MQLVFRKLDYVFPTKACPNLRTEMIPDVYRHICLVLPKLERSGQITLYNGTLLVFQRLNSFSSPEFLVGVHIGGFAGSCRTLVEDLSDEYFCELHIV